MNAAALGAEGGEAPGRQCLAGGGVALFPADTVYGLGCDPESASAVERLYRLKGRGSDRPAAVMFFALAHALEALPELEAAERAAVRALLPGPLTLLLPNRSHRFPLACGPDAGHALGLRVPLLGELAGGARHGARADAPVERQPLGTGRGATAGRRAAETLGSEPI